MSDMNQVHSTTCTESDSPNGSTEPGAESDFNDWCACVWMRSGCDADAVAAVGRQFRRVCLLQHDPRDRLFLSRADRVRPGPLRTQSLAGRGAAWRALHAQLRHGCPLLAEPRNNLHLGQVVHTHARAHVPPSPSSIISVVVLGSRSWSRKTGLASVTARLSLHRLMTRDRFVCFTVSRHKVVAVCLVWKFLLCGSHDVSS